MIILNKNVEKGTYIDIRRINKLYSKCAFYIIFGARGLGKTTTLTKKLHSEYKNQIKKIKNKVWTLEEVRTKAIDKEIQNKFVWLFRWDLEIDKKKNETFAEFGWVASGENVYWQIEIQVLNEKGFEETRIYPLQVGKITALNNASTLRGGNSFNSYKFLIWDEFMDENGKYLLDEDQKLFSIMQTILRTKKVEEFSAYFLSNSVRKDAPLFKLFDFDPDMLSLGQQAYYPEKYTVIYRPKTSEELKEKQENSAFVKFAGKDNDYVKYALQDEFLNKDDLGIIRTLDNRYALKPIHNIIYLDKEFGVYNYKGGLYISDELNTGKMYPLTKADAIKKGLQTISPDKLYIWYNSLWIKQRLFFSDDMVKQVVLTFLQKTNR